MVDIKSVTSYFLNKSCLENNPITPKKLQKLLYYIQSWHLTVFKSPIFNLDFQAWRHGPVQPNVYHEYSHLGYHYIPGVREFNEGIFTEQQRLLLSEIWKIYGPYSGDDLEFFTHIEEPWKKTRSGLPDNAACTRVIDQKLMREFYTLKMNKLVSTESPNISDEFIKRLRIEEKIFSDNLNKSPFLDFAGSWKGNDLDDCIEDVYASRSDVSFH